MSSSPLPTSCLLNMASKRQKQSIHTNDKAPVNAITMPQKLPDELLIMIAEQAEGDHHLGELRLVNSYMRLGASKRLFSHLSKTFSFRAFSTLSKISRSPWAKYVKTLEFRASVEEEFDLIGRYQGAPETLRSTASHLKHAMARFTNVTDISFAVGEADSMSSEQWQELFGKLMHTMCQVMVDKGRSRRLGLSFDGHASYSDLQQVWMGRADHKQRFENFVSKWKELSLTFEVCNCIAGIAFSLPAGFLSCVTLQSLELSSNTSWITFQNKRRSDVPSNFRYKFPNLKTLKLRGVFCTAKELNDVLTSTCQSLQSVNLENFILNSVTDTDESRWADVFDLLILCTNLVDFQYKWLTTWSSPDNRHLPAFEPRQKESHWKHGLKVVLGAKEDDKRSLGRLLNMVKERATKAKLPYVLDPTDKSYCRLAATSASHELRSGRPRRAAAVKAAENISSYSKVVEDYVYWARI